MNLSPVASDPAPGAGGLGGAAFRLVRLPNGRFSIHSVEVGETFHPVIGPEAEAQTLYVAQLQLPARWRAERGEFVVWDVGLGAAANTLALIRAAGGAAVHLRILSFDQTLEPLRFGLHNAARLGYFSGFESHLRSLERAGRVSFAFHGAQVEWEAHIADFPSLLAGPEAARWPKPHFILFDAYSPARNPAMWTLPLFSRLYQLLDASRPCALATYSRSTMLRVTLLCAGFFVGMGMGTGRKEETTLAANARELIARPLNRQWLATARRSTSAEPLHTPVYRQTRLSEETWDCLLRHPQFQGL